MSYTIQQTTNDWLSINATSGIIAGTRLKLQNQTVKFFRIQESATKPDISNFEGELITGFNKEEPSKIITEGSPEVWIRNDFVGDGEIKLFVQEWAV